MCAAQKGKKEKEKKGGEEKERGKKWRFFFFALAGCRAFFSFALCQIRKAVFISFIQINNNKTKASIVFFCVLVLIKEQGVNELLLFFLM